MSRCEYFSVWDPEEQELSEWGEKLSDEFETEVNDEDKQQEVRWKVIEYPQLYERENIDEDALSDDQNEALRKAEATRESAGLPVKCPHEQVAGEGCCKFHIPPSRYDDHEGLTGESVCESFLRTIQDAKEDDNERVKCFAGSQFEKLSLSYRTLTSESNRPIQLQYADIGEIDMDAAVVDERLLFDGTKIGSISCENVRFRREVSFERVDIDCETILFANSVFNEEVSFRGAHLSANDIDFQYCTFESAGRFNHLDLELKNGDREKDINFGYTTFDGEFDCSGSTFFLNEGVDDTAEPYLDFYQSEFMDDVSLSDCEFISGERNQESGTMFESMVNQDSDDSDKDDYESQWILLFDESEFDKGIDMEKTTVEGDVKFSQVDFGRGDIVFEDIDINGKAEFKQTLFSGRIADFSDMTVRESLYQSGSAYNVAGGQIDFSGLTVKGTAYFRQTTLTGNDIDFSESKIACRGSRNDQDGKAAIDFQGMNLEGGVVTFWNSTFGGPTSYDYATITGEEFNFNQIEVAGALTFKHAKFHATKTDFAELVVRDAARFDLSHTDHTSNSATFEEMEITCDEEIQFSSSSFECEASFDDTLFKCAKIDFSHVSTESGALDFERVESGDDPIKFSDATVTDGSFVIGEYDTVYDFTSATIGDIKIRAHDDDDSDAEGKLFEHFIFKNTEFDGFDFSDDKVKQQLKRTRWAIHTSHQGEDQTGEKGFVGSQHEFLRRYYRLFTVGPDETTDPNELEVTYMKAKLGADQKGDPDAVSQFFQKELHFRRKAYGYQFWDRSGTYDSLYQSIRERAKTGWDWFANTTLRLTVGYGESPRNVVLTSMFVILVFTGIYRTIDALPSNASEIDYITYSFQGFIQLLFGAKIAGGVIVRLLTAVEGFIGAFIIALFVITLTRSINR